MQNVQQQLETCVTKEQVKIHEPMRNHTTFQIGGNADYYVTVKTMEQAKQVVEVAKRCNLPITYIGNGSNILVKDTGIRGIVVKNEIDTFSIEGTTIHAGAGMMIARLAYLAYQEGLAGLEFASGIPGTVGGAVKMNAGAHASEMKDILTNVTYLDEMGTVITKPATELEFSYRHSYFSTKKHYMILQATMQLEKADKEQIKSKMEEYATYRKGTQPIGMPSAGSSFKRGDGFITAQLIDACGLKGYQIGGAQISTKHAGFIVNTGNATCEDVLQLAKYIQQVIQETYQKKIELEFDVIG